jgi:serine/threonine protein kinase/tetratricopeptide (TPR) repeat protein
MLTSYGRYRLLEQLGQGRLTEVHKAKSLGVEGFEKTLVVKKLRPELARQAAFVRAFVEQAALAMRLSHANVVQVFDSGRIEIDDGIVYYLAEEHVAGLTLARLLEHQGRRALPMALCLYVGIEVAKALDHAHRRRDDRMKPLGIGHGALTPRNVLISWDGQVKVSDFCLHRAAREPADSVPLDGTAAEDVRSLGGLLVSMLSGAELDAEALAQDPDALIRATDLYTDGELQSIVRRAVVTSPDQPFGGAADLYEALLMQAYRAREKAGALELAQVIARYRSPSAAPDGPPTLDAPPSVAPPPSSLRPSRRPSWPPLPDRREITCFVLRLPEAQAELIARARLIVRRYGGRVLHTATDELSGIFGAQRADLHDAEHAVRCGRMLVRALVGDCPSASMGIVDGRVLVEQSDDLEHTGEIAAALDLAGDLALRYPGHVAISRSTLARLGERFEIETAPDAGLIVGERSVHTYHRRFLGRRREFASLGERLLTTTKREVQVLALLGEAGIGKTSLLSEMGRRLERAGYPIGFHVAVCPPGGPEQLGSALGSMLRAVLGLEEAEPAESSAAASAKLRVFGLTQSEAEAALNELGGVQSPSPSAPDEVLERAVERAFGKVMSAMAGEGTHVLVWDDAQHLDERSATVLDELVGKLRASRLLIVFAARSEGEHLFRKLPGCSDLVLERLEPEDARRLAARTLGLDAIPDELADFVEERAAGHPVLIAELVRAALDAGAVRTQGTSVVHLDLDAALATPRPLRLLVTDRLRRLPEHERDLALAVAIVGAPADVAVVAHMLGCTPEEASALADQLEQRGLLARKRSMQLGFSTPLVAEVILSDLGQEQRRALHQAAASAYDHVMGHADPDMVEAAARHRLASGDRRRAAELYADSGFLASAMGQRNRAAMNLLRGLETADLEAIPEAVWAGWLTALRQTVGAAPERPMLLRVLRKLETRCECTLPAEMASRVSVLTDLGRIRAQMHDHAAAKRLLGAALSLAEPHDDLRRTTLLARGELEVDAGDYVNAVKTLQEAEQLGPSDPEEWHRLLLASAEAHAAFGNAALAYERLRQAHFDTLSGDVAGTCAMARTEALLLWHGGAYEICARAAATAADVCQAAGLPLQVAFLAHLEALARVQSEDLPHAYAAVERALALAEEAGADRLRDQSRMLQSFVVAMGAEAGAAGEALAAFAEYVVAAEARGDAIDEAFGRYLHARLLVLTGQGGRARHELELSLGQAELRGMRRLATDCRAELARLTGADR